MPLESPKEYKEEEKQPDRREFLKRAGRFALGAVGLGAAGLAANRVREREEEITAETLSRDEGIVIGKDVHTTQKSEWHKSWEIRVSIQGKEAPVYVTPEDYESFAVGDRVIAYYSDREKSERFNVGDRILVGSITVSSLEKDGKQTINQYPGKRI